MNERGREVLRQAALDGIPQVTGSYHTMDAYCGVGVLGKAMGLDLSACTYMELNAALAKINIHFDLVQDWTECPLCLEITADQMILITHLNDTHKLDFLGLANKL